MIDQFLTSVCAAMKRIKTSDFFKIIVENIEQEMVVFKERKKHQVAKPCALDEGERNASKCFGGCLFIHNSFSFKTGHGPILFAIDIFILNLAQLTDIKINNKFAKPTWTIISVNMLQAFQG